MKERVKQNAKTPMPWIVLIVCVASAVIAYINSSDATALFGLCTAVILLLVMLTDDGT